MGVGFPAVEGLVNPNQAFWRGRRVLVTGHTGFKGSWLTLWLRELGADVSGLALPPSTNPSLFDLVGGAGVCRSVIGDVRDLRTVVAAVEEARPAVVLHLAAQALVRASYADPVDTYATNVMGTVHLLEAVRRVRGIRAVVNVTSDKCYESHESPSAHREADPMGGRDPYSSSKGCAELVTAAYRRSFFHPSATGAILPALASARAGNVVGGGDWAEDRIVPDCMRAFAAGQPARVRSPAAIRPWQHVLEPLAGYLVLAERLYEHGAAYAEAWNFGPLERDARPVAYVAETLARLWGAGASWQTVNGPQPPEATHLAIDGSKARARLGWTSRLSVDEALAWTARWYRDRETGADPEALCLQQIRHYRELGGS